MSPPPDPRMERYDGRKVRNPTRAGGSETSKADPSDSRNLEAQAGRDVIPPEGEEVGPATTSGCPDGWGERSEGGNPKKASTVLRLRPVDGSTDSPREQGPEGGRSRSVPLGGWFGRQRQEGKDSERSTARARGEHPEG